MPMRNKLIVPAMVAGVLSVGVLGGTLINSLGANAATNSTTSTSGTAGTTSNTNTEATTPADNDNSQGGHVGSNGVKEVVLTGDTADKVKAAALAAVPGGTVLRVENDAEGATYEAHMTKSDGTRVTVKLDANFKVTSTENGFGMHQ